MATMNSNINWRRGITTQNNATTNAALQLQAQNMFSMTTQSYANLWQEHRDQIDYAFRSEESQKERDLGTTAFNGFTRRSFKLLRR